MPIKLHRTFAARDLERLPVDELLAAARWWARNAAMMSAADPWKPQMQLLPLIALLSPSVAAFGVWLEQAHEAVRGTSTTSLYHAAYLELRAEHPPWTAAADANVDGPRLSQEHGTKPLQTMCLVEMRYLLDEIRADAKQSMPAGSAIIFGSR